MNDEYERAKKRLEAGIAEDVASKLAARRGIEFMDEMARYRKERFTVSMIGSDADKYVCVGFSMSNIEAGEEFRYGGMLIVAEEPIKDGEKIYICLDSATGRASLPQTEPTNSLEDCW